MKLFWSVLEESDVVYSDELNEISRKNPNFNFSIWLSNKKGFLTIDKLDIDDYKSEAYFVCGPESLKKSIMKQLVEKGVKKDDIYDKEFSFR